MHTVLLHMTICDLIAACTGNSIGLVVNAMGYFPTENSQLFGGGFMLIFKIFPK